MLRLLITCFALLQPLAGTALAADGRWTFSTYDWLARAPTVLDDDNPGDDVFVRGELALVAMSNNWLRYIQPLGGGDSLRYGLGLRVSDYITENDLDAILVTNRFEYWLSLGQSRSWQLRMGGDYAFNLRDGDVRYGRLCSDFAAVFRPDRKQQGRIRLRLCDFNYNDDVQVGFDQSRAGLLAAYRWRPTGELRNELEGQVFSDIADADFERYGFVRHGVGLKGSLAMGPVVDLLGYNKFWHQVFSDDFSAGRGFERRDTRFETGGGLRFHLGNNMRLNVLAGYLVNKSNIDERDFSGVTGHIGFEYRTNGYY